MVRTQPCNKPRALDTARHISGEESNLLLEAHMLIMKNELRIKLLRSLLDKNLATRDIFSFLKTHMFAKYLHLPSTVNIFPF